MRKTLVAMSLGMLAVLMLAAPALAGRTWCARDPIIRVNGHDVQMWVAIPEEYVSLVNGPIAIEILTAIPVDAEVLFLDDGFNGYGETVTFGALTRGNVYSDGSFDLQLRVRVPISSKKVRKIPLQATFTIGGSATTVSTVSTVSAASSMLSTDSVNTVTYSGGYTFTVEMTNDNTTLTARFPAS